VRAGGLPSGNPFVPAARDCRVPTVHQVSKALGISQGYLTKDGKYMQRLFALLKVRGRTQAVAEAMRRRLID